MHEAAQLLAALGKDRFTSQTFADATGARDRPAIAHGPHAAQHRRLQHANDAGMGIFHMVNQGDLQGRRAENVTAITAYFADLDGAPIPDPWPLPPTAVIESSHQRYHAYWRVTDAPLDAFAHVQKHIALLLNADPKVHDLPRVMRLPGYHHRKGEAFLSRILTIGPADAYTHAMILDAFAVPEPEPVRERRPLPAAVQAYIGRTHGAGPKPKRDLDTAAARIATAPEGHRNHTLYRVAAAVANQIKNGEISRGEAEQHLELAALTAGLEPHEITPTLRSAFRHS